MKKQRHTIPTLAPLAFASFLALALLLTFVPLSSAQSWSGECVAVADGDTVKVMRDRERLKIRLYGIDCPEKRQAFGTRAKVFTSDMVFGKTVQVKPAVWLC